MHPLRRVARVLLASTFIAGGLDAVLKPGRRVPRTDGLLGDVPTSKVPGLDGMATEDLIRTVGGVQVGAGALLASDRLPRLSSLALAASLAAETAALHRFWEIKTPDERRAQQTLFFKNASLLGGLLIASADTEGRPGLGWRARHRADHVGKAARRRKREAKAVAKAAKASLPG
jgi:uncharacterized membrane protein YphA (DoxX/SURF4 family)